MSQSAWLIQSHRPSGPTKAMPTPACSGAAGVHALPSLLAPSARFVPPLSSIDRPQHGDVCRPVPPAASSGLAPVHAPGGIVRRTRCIAGEGRPRYLLTDEFSPNTVQRRMTIALPNSLVG